MLILVVVALFIAFGLSPVVQWLIRHNVRHSVAVLLVALGFVAALALFVLAIAPVVADQLSTLTKNAPGYFDQLQHNRQIEKLDAKYDIIDKAKDYVTSGDLTQQVFGGVLGVGLAILRLLANAFIVLVLTLYFMASLDTIKRNLYRLAPASRRETVAHLGDRILDGHRRLRLRRLHRRAVRRAVHAGLPVHRRPGRVRRGAGPRGGGPRRDPDDRRDPRRGRSSARSAWPPTSRSASPASSSTSSTSRSRTT